MNKKTNDHDSSEATCPVSVEDVDLFCPGAQEFWYEAYDILHEQDDVHRLPGEGFADGTDAFVLTRHEDIARVVRDEERFPLPGSMLVRQLASQLEQNPETDLLTQPGISTMFASMATLRPTPELWRAHRQELTDPFVGPGAPRHKPMVQRVANELIDKFINRGQVEWISEFAQPLPQMTMANVLGWPISDLSELKRFGDGCVKPFVYGRGHRNQLTKEEAKEQFDVLDEFEAYTDELIRHKRQHPAEDMISFLTEVEYSPLQRKLNDKEINGIVYAMVIGGLETTQYALAEQVQLLIEDPDTWQAIRNDANDIRNFTEEGMRLRSPTQGLSTRITSQDEVFQGVTVPKGSFLHLRWAAANIDPNEWDEAKKIKLDRKAGTRHLTFSQGARVCPGATLSRVEQVTAWEVVTKRISTFKFAENNKFLHQPGIMLGTLELNLEFEKTN